MASELIKHNEKKFWEIPERRMGKVKSIIGLGLVYSTQAIVLLNKCTNGTSI